MAGRGNDPLTPKRGAPLRSRRMAAKSAVAFDALDDELWVDEEPGDLPPLSGHIGVEENGDEPDVYVGDESADEDCGLSDANEIDELIRLEASEDPMHMYLREIGQVPLLTAEEEFILATAIQKGKAAERLLKNNDLAGERRAAVEQLVAAGDIAQRRLVLSNLRLVVSVADPALGFKFSTYASWWIRQAISRSIADQARTIRIPVHMVESINRLLRIQRKLLQELGREPTSEEIALEMGLLAPEDTQAITAYLNRGQPLDPALNRRLWRAAHKVRRIIRISQEPVSLEMPIGSEQNSFLGDFIEDETLPGPADAATQQFLREQMLDALGELSERERNVLEMRFGLLDGQSRTLEEVGAQFGVTRERIRQIEAKALRKLRHPQRSKKLRDYLS